MGIGTTTPAALLHVNGDALFDGNITVTGLVNGVTIPDYVFQKYFEGFSNLNPNYEILQLEEVEEFIRKYHHLPGIPSAQDFNDYGGLVLDRSVLLNLEKIEELFLHTIEQEKKIKALEKENEELLNHLIEIKAQIQEIKTQLNK